MCFGLRLKQLRNQNNFTQKQMSEKLAMEQSTYSKYENDKLSPNIEIVKRVGARFNVSIEWLMRSDSNHIGCFEQGSTNNGNDFIQTKNFYAVHKDLMDVFFKQQQTIKHLVKQILEKLK